MFNPFRFLNPFKSASRRRREPEFRLEARLRAAANSRRRQVGVRFIPWVILLGVLLGGGYGLLRVTRDQWLYRVPALALKTIQVRRDGALSESEILATAGLRTGMNTLALDLPALQARLHRHPRIERAELARELPGTLRLTIRERFPVARVRPGNPTNDVQLDTFYLLDESGFTLLPFRPGKAPNEVLEAESALPVIVGAATTNFVPGRAISDSATVDALRLLAAFEVSAMAVVTDILTLDISQPGDLVATTSSGSRITFGRRDFDPNFSLQLRRWQAVHQESLRQSRMISRLDVGVLNHAPLHWLDENQSPAPPPAAPKPKRLKPARRHA